MRYYPPSILMWAQNENIFLFLGGKKGVVLFWLCGLDESFRVDLPVTWCWGVASALSSEIYSNILLPPTQFVRRFFEGGEAALPQSQFLISDQVITIINFRRTICQMAPIPFLGFLQHPKTILVSISDYGRQRSRV